jgi:hypothetical protein
MKMKKYLLTLLIAFSLQAQAQLWNIQLDKDPTILGSGLAGVIWTGTEFWCAAWATADIYVADANGNALSPASFTIPGVSGTRSMTTDGSHIYIGTAATSIYKVDPITKTLISTISTSVPACRYLTYDHTLDNGNGGFWTGAYASDIVAVSMTGATLSSISAAIHGLSGIYGMAFDGYSTGGPYLWAFDQGGNGSDIIQLSITGTPTGISHDATTDLGAGGSGLAGGLFICNNFITGTNSIIGLSQGISLFSYELGDPPTDDPILDAIDIDAYVLNPSNVDIKGTITNGGLNTITSIDVKWSDGINTYTDNLTGLNISMNGTYNFIHSTQLIINSLGTNSLTIWIEYPADVDTSNNTLSTNVTAITAIAVRKPLIETFTSSTCGPCNPANVTAEALFAQNPGKFTSIKYQADWPGSGDPYYTDEVGNRIAYYAINSVPRMEIDGGWDQNGNNITQQVLDDHIDVISLVNLSATYSINIKSVDIDITIDPLENYLSTNLVIHVAIIEETTYNNVKNNGETQFEHVVKKMLPNDNGTSIPSLVGGTQSTLNQSFTFNGNYRLPTDASNPVNHTIEHSVEDFSNLMVAVWIQDVITKEVHQSTMATLSSIVSETFNCVNNSCTDPLDGSGTYNDINSCETACNITSVQENNTSEFNIYPNPIKDVLTIDGTYNSVNIYDVFGKLVLTSQTKKIIDVSSLSNGIYFVNINTENTITVKKITIAK